MDLRALLGLRTLLKCKVVPYQTTVGVNHSRSLLPFALLLESVDARKVRRCRLLDVAPFGILRAVGGILVVGRHGDGGAFAVRPLEAVANGRNDYDSILLLVRTEIRFDLTSERVKRFLKLRLVHERKFCFELLL